MTLLLTIFAAVIVTVVWYCGALRNMRLELLIAMYWGAALMWLCDAVAGYLEDGAEFFTPPTAEMVNDTYLGFYVIALGLVIWVAAILITDPRGTVRAALQRQRAAKAAAQHQAA